MIVEFPLREVKIGRAHDVLLDCLIESAEQMNEEDCLTPKQARLLAEALKDYLALVVVGPGERSN